MKNTSRSIIRNVIILTLAVGLLVGLRVLHFSGAQNATAKKEKINLYDVVDSVDDLVKTYHENTNKLFNDRIELMAKRLADEKDAAKRLALLTPPPKKKDKEGHETGEPRECKSKDGVQNVSTYCLAIDATSDYFDFRDRMLTLRDLAEKAVPAKIQTPKGASTFQQPSAFGAIGDLVQGQQSVQNYGATLDRIDREVDVARQALDQALAAYNELQMALPLHQKYLEVIKSLEKYRDKVAAIRKDVEQLPPLFLNATTTQCT